MDKWTKSCGGTREHRESDQAKKLLDNEGFSLEEARELRNKFKKSNGGLFKAELQAYVTKVAEAEERERDTVRLSAPGVSYEDTTVGMGIKARAELELLEGSLACAVDEFEKECSDARKEALKEAQSAWLEFRNVDAKLHRLLAEGGSIAPLLDIGHQIALTEERIKEIRLLQAEANL